QRFPSCDGERVVRLRQIALHNRRQILVGDRIGLPSERPGARLLLHAAVEWRTRLFQRLRAVAVGAAQVTAIRPDKYLPMPYEDPFSLNRREHFHEANTTLLTLCC